MPRYLARHTGRFGRGLRIADLPGWVATQGEVFTADPFGGKKGDREDPDVCRIFSVALKEGWLYCTDMPLSYLAVRKTTAFNFIWRPQGDKSVSVTYLFFITFMPFLLAIPLSIPHNAKKI